MTPFLIAAALFAAEPKPKEIVFDPDVVDGTLDGPDLNITTADHPPRFGSLVRVRKDFNDKIAKERLP